MTLAASLAPPVAERAFRHKLGESSVVVVLVDRSAPAADLLALADKAVPAAVLPKPVLPPAVLPEPALPPAVQLPLVDRFALAE